MRWLVLSLALAPALLAGCGGAGHDTTGGSTQANSVVLDDQGTTKRPSWLAGFPQCARAYGGRAINTSHDARTASRLIRSGQLVRPAAALPPGHLFAWDMRGSGALHRVYVFSFRQITAAEASQRTLGWLTATHQTSPTYVLLVWGRNLGASIDHSCAGSSAK
jgi:hypothetical protein